MLTVETSNHGIYFIVPQPALRNAIRAIIDHEQVLAALLLLNILLAIPKVRKYLTKIFSSSSFDFIYYWALIIRDDTIDSFDCRRAHHHYMVGNVHRERGRHEDSLRHFVDARNIVDELSSLGMKIDPIINVGCQANIASALSNQGLFTDAKDEYQNAIATLEKADEGNSIHAAKVYNNYAITLKNNGELEESAKSYNRALDIYRAFDGYGAEIARICSNLSLTLAKKGDLKTALDMCQQALHMKLRNKQIGPDHILTAITYNNKGTILRLMGKLDEALKCHQNALRIKTMNTEKNIISIAHSKRDLASVLFLRFQRSNIMKVNQEKVVR